MIFHSCLLLLLLVQKYYKILKLQHKTTFFCFMQISQIVCMAYFLNFSQAQRNSRWLI